MATKSTITFTVTSASNFLFKIQQCIESNLGYGDSGFQRQGANPLQYLLTLPSHLPYTLEISATTNPGVSVDINQTGYGDATTTPTTTSVSYPIGNSIEIDSFLAPNGLLILSIHDTSQSVHDLLGMVVPQEMATWYQVANNPTVLFFNNPKAFNSAYPHFLVPANTPFTEETTTLARCSLFGSFHSLPLERQTSNNITSQKWDILTKLLVFCPI